MEGDAANMGWHGAGHGEKERDSTQWNTSAFLLVYSLLLENTKKHWSNNNMHSLKPGSGISDLARIHCYTLKQRSARLYIKKGPGEGMQQTIHNIHAPYSLSTTHALEEAMSPKSWPPMGLILLVLIITISSLTLPLEAGPSCAEMIGGDLVGTISNSCLLAFYPGKPRPDPVAEGECCRALAQGLERSKGNRCLCSFH